MGAKKPSPNPSLAGGVKKKKPPLRRGGMVKAKSSEHASWFVVRRAKTFADEPRDTHHASRSTIHGPIEYHPHLNSLPSRARRFLFFALTSHFERQRILLHA